MHRRTVPLTVGGLLGGGGLAGCLDEGSRGERSSPGSTTPAATDATETPEQPYSKGFTRW